MRTHFRIIATLALLLAGAVPFSSAQSLLDNDFYKNGKDLLAQAQSALDAGNYDGAGMLAKQATDSFALSDQYVASMTLFYRANGALSVANDRIAYAKSIKADVNYKDAYTTATTAAASAKQQLDVRNYNESMQLSQSVLDALKDIAPLTAKAPAPAPAPAATPAEPGDTGSAAVLHGAAHAALEGLPLAHCRIPIRLQQPVEVAAPVRSEQVHPPGTDESGPDRGRPAPRHPQPRGRNEKR